MRQPSSMSLAQLRQVELGLLAHFQAFCRAHQISYLLSNGTLLGAVKYGGFIPWDDDIDILIPRPDYDRFLREYADSEKYKLFSHQRVAGYGFPFAKLCDMDTRKDEPNNDNGVALGVDIDIFPLDGWGNTPAQAHRRAKRQARDLLLLRLAKNRQITPSPVPGRTAVKRAVAALCRRIGPGFFIRRMDARARRGGMAYQGCAAWPVYGAKEVLPAAVFRETVMLEFEGIPCPAPVGYEAYLRSLYGDYRQDPPAEKQRTHHDFRAWFCRDEAPL